MLNASIVSESGRAGISVFGQSRIDETAERFGIGQVAKLPINPGWAASCDAGEIESIQVPELAQIAGYLHDIGNVINRADHAQSGAVMAFRILDKLGADAEDTATIISAIGNHDEGTAVAVDAVAAALILADKTDVRRSRVRNRDMATFDIHDRVNYAVEEASTEISPDKSMITLRIRIDTASAAVMDYFEIFLQRMLLCRKAAERLGLRFGLVINDQVVL